jgi:hypothetical protein
MADRFPRPYQNDVPKESDKSMMQTVDFPNMGIGARPSGLPKEASMGPKSLEHVGKSAEGSKGKR